MWSHRLAKSLMDEDDLIHLYVISDSLGEIGTSIANAIRLQFQGQFAMPRRYPLIRDISEINDILLEAAKSRCMVIYTLVMPETREFIVSRGNELQLTLVDVLGPVMDVAKVMTHREPIYEAGLNRRLDEEYFRKVAAVEFAVKYDDGTDPSSLHKADIVLVGISRTSKTPLSMYLAYRNFKVANVPLIPGVNPPDELFEIDKHKIFGLTNSSERLHSIRTERLRDLGIQKSENYANLTTIEMELEYANQIFQQLDCPVINVANRSIEETAVMIISMINQREEEGIS